MPNTKLNRPNPIYPRWLDPFFGVSQKYLLKLGDGDAKRGYDKMLDAFIARWNASAKINRFIPPTSRENGMAWMPDSSKIAAEARRLRAQKIAPKKTTTTKTTATEPAPPATADNRPLASPPPLHSPPRFRYASAWESARQSLRPFAGGEESPGSTGQRRRVIPGRREPTESATENIPPRVHPFAAAA